MAGLGPRLERLESALQPNGHRCEACGRPPGQPAVVRMPDNGRGDRGFDYDAAVAELCRTGSEEEQIEAQTCPVCRSLPAVVLVITPWPDDDRGPAAGLA